jgi:hypothetical protein
MFEREKTVRALDGVATVTGASVKLFFVNVLKNVFADEVSGRDKRSES